MRSQKILWYHIEISWVKKIHIGPIGSIRKVVTFFLFSKKFCVAIFLTSCYKLLHKYQKKNSKFGPIDPVQSLQILHFCKKELYNIFILKKLQIITQFFFEKMQYLKRLNWVNQVNWAKLRKKIFFDIGVIKCYKLETC